jgi:hypothetical protein
VALHLVITVEPFDPASLELLKTLGNTREVGPTAWAIHSKDLTSKDISEKLFPPKKNPDTGSLTGVRHIVVRFDNWFGFHDRALWEWLDTAKKGDAQ